MQQGWSARGLLRPLWQSYPGKRDGLARDVGTTGSVLSSINSGKRNLALDLGPRLAATLGVTIYDLGAPADVQVAGQAATLIDRVTALEAELERTQLELAELRHRRGDEE